MPGVWDEYVGLDFSFFSGSFLDFSFFLIPVFVLKQEIAVSRNM